MNTAELLKKVRKIEIKTRGLSSQVFAGQYHSIFKGKGMTFSEVREYQYGDDIRNIDWNVTARFNHPYVKIFEEERELTVILLVDVSASTDFGTQTQLKRETLTEIAAVLSFSAIQNNDKVGIIFFSSKVEKYIPPKKGTSHILRIIRELIEFKPEEKGTNLNEALKYLTNTQKKKCTAFILSDFMNTNFIEGLQIAARKHDLMAIRIDDAREKSIPSIGLVKIKDAESGSEHWIDSSDTHTQNCFSQWWSDHENTISSIFNKLAIDHISMHTGQDYIKPLKNLFNKREAKW